MSDYNASDTTRVFADSDLFFEQLTADIKNAQKSVRIQCMSFEADQVGTKLIELLSSKPTLDRTLLIDHYSRFVVNDTFLNAPQGWMNHNNARKERKQLDILLAEAGDAGIKVKFTSPMGLLMYRYPARNHKKMVLIDDHISYLGGLNFTEHNFRWADLMVRHENPLIVNALDQSFEADLHETQSPEITELSDTLTLYTLNGFKTKSAYHALVEQIKSCQKVVAISPYISFPMLDAIAGVPENMVILPKLNNKPVLNFVHRLNRYSNIHFRYVQGEMVHTKLLILDDKIAVYGSSNFDTVSYFFEKEVILANQDPKLIGQLTNIVTELLNN